MRRASISYVIVLVSAAALFAAQEKKTTTDTKVTSDNGKVITMTGCIEVGGGTSFLLTNITSEHEQHRAATPHAGGPYSLVARKGLELGPYIQQKVELTGVEVPAATRGDRDAKIKIEQKTTQDATRGTDAKPTAETTVKVKRGADAQFLVASVKVLAPSCQP